MNDKHKKISLKEALSLIETIYIHGDLHKFSIVHAYSDINRRTEIATRNLCTRINPNSEEKNINFKEIGEQNGNGKLKKTYNAFDKRIFRIFDNEKNKYVSIKVDLILKFNDKIVEH